MTDTAPLAHTDVLVLDYLAALWAASDDLAPELRDELMTTVADYIAMRRVAQVDPIEDPGQVLRRLGAPEDLAAAARRGRIPAHLRRPVAAELAVPVPVSGSSGAEYAGIALLTAGAVVFPVVSPLAGMLLVSGSPRWSPAQKTAAWVLAGGSVLFAFVMVIAGLASGLQDEVLVLGYLAMTGGAFLAGLTLLPGLTARRHYSR